MVDYPWDASKDARGIFVWFKAAVECTTTSDEMRGGNTMDQSLSQIPNPRMHNNLRRAYKTRVQLCNSLYQPSTTRHCQVLPVEPGTTRYWITWGEFALTASFGQARLKCRSYREIAGCTWMQFGLLLAGKCCCWQVMYRCWLASDVQVLASGCWQAVGDSP